jgi:3-deoxy-D-manno-octulosonic-acid transferase
MILRWRLGKGKEDGQRVAERLGRASVARPEGPLVWLHAASVGEAGAVLPLMARLVEMRPDANLLLTTGTVTSARFVASRMPPQTIHQYVPLDSPVLVDQFLAHWRPSLAVFTEQEIWPNLVLETARLGIPMALVNARMSDASFDRWQRRIAMAEALFGRFDVVLAQNDVLAGRFRRLGARRTVAAGNLKVDAPPLAVDSAAFASLETALCGRPRLLAASTHAGEETAVARAHQRLAGATPGLVSIIAPRHPERGEAIAREIAAMGLQVARRSQGRLPEVGTDVYLADTIGELGTLYASTPVAFIGGSLVPHGGQNPIEAIRHGAGVVAGPHTHNFADAFAALAREGGAEIVGTPDALAPTLAGLLGDPVRLERLRRGATQALEGLSGALATTCDALLELMPAGPASDRPMQRAV